MEYDSLIGRLAGGDAALEARLRETYPSLHAILGASPRELRKHGVSETVSALPSLVFAVTRRERIDTLSKLRIRSRGDADELCAWFLAGEKLPASVLIPLDARGKTLPPRFISRGRKYSMYELIDVILEDLRDAGAVRFVVGHNYEPAIPVNKAAYAADADRLFRAIRPFGTELFDYVLVSGAETFSVMGWALGPN
ncbi:MAG: hypothetical protein MJ088_01470 [Clostridia bacterium]|nr:hypothetical protein [Clostridia bacterium]